MPTYQGSVPLAVSFSLSLEEYHRQNIDLYIYDSSEGDETKNLVAEWQTRFDNLFYIRYPSSIHSNEKVYKIYQFDQMQKEYDYIWVCRDARFCTRNVLEYLRNAMQAEYSIICIGYFLIRNQYEVVYKDPNQMFRELAWYLTLYGAAVIHCKDILNHADWNYYEKKYLTADKVNFSHTCLYLEQSLKLDNRFSAIYYNAEYEFDDCLGRRVSAWRKETFPIWLEIWPSAIRALPDAYTDKKEVIVSFDKMTGLFGTFQLLELRRDGILTVQTYWKYRLKWKDAAELSRLRFFLISIMPRKLTKVLLNRQFIIPKPTPCDKDKLENLLQQCKACKSRYIYGTGLISMRYSSYFINNQINYTGYLVTKLEKGKEKFLAHPVYQYDEWKDKNKNKNETCIILAMSGANIRQVLPQLLDAGIQILY
jgi:hypothetical protein